MNQNQREGQNENQQIGEVIRLLRIARGMTPASLAEKTGVSYSHIIDIEGGKKQPSLIVLQKVSEALDVKMSTMMFFLEEQQEKSMNYQEFLLTILQRIVEPEMKSKKEND